MGGLEEYLIAKGLYPTGFRKRILQTIMDSGTALTEEDIYLLLSEEPEREKIGDAIKLMADRNVLITILKDGITKVFYVPVPTYHMKI